MNSLTHVLLTFQGAEEDIARNTLEACNWNVEMAINMYVDSNFSASALPSNNQPEPTITSEPLEGYALVYTIFSIILTTTKISTEIRPPIPPVRQVLVEDYPAAYNFRRNASFDNFRNFEQETSKNF